MTAVMHTHLKVRGTLLLWAIALAFALAALLPAHAHAASVLATGTVTDVNTGLPMEGVLIEAMFSIPGVGWSDRFGTQTGADGTYALPTPFGAGNYTIIATWDPEHPNEVLTVHWDGGAPLALDFAFDVPVPVGAGTVTDADSGLPIASAWIDAYYYDPTENMWMWSDLDFTDTSGAYALYDHYAHGTGKYRVTAWAPGYVRQILNGNWNGETPLASDFALEPLVSVVDGPFPFIPVEGPDRFATAVAASQDAFPDGLYIEGARTVIIATGQNWPDALGGAALAGILDGPVLLVEEFGVPDAVLEEIKRLNASRVIILGGTGAVNMDIELVFRNTIGWDNVTRIGGADRYETANLIAAEVRELLGIDWGGEALVATGENFPDALAAATIAAAQGIPLYLAHPVDGLSQATRDAMEGVTSAIILGETGAVSANTENYLVGRLGSENVTRLGGADRFETAVEVAQWAVEAKGHSWDRAGIATGLDFADALTGGILQGEMRSVTLLTRPGVLNPHTHAALVTNKNVIHTLTFFGGTGAVSPAVRAAALSAAD